MAALLVTHLEYAAAQLDFVFIDWVEGDGPVHKLSVGKVGANMHKFVRVQVETQGFR